MGLQKVGHDWVRACVDTHTHTHKHTIIDLPKYRKERKKPVETDANFTNNFIIYAVYLI